MLKLKNCRSLLIIRPDRIGDLTLSLAVPAAIKAVHHQVKIDYLVSAYAADLLKYSDYVDDWILHSDTNGRLIPTAKLIELISAREYSAVIFLKPNWQSAFAAFLAGIPIRIGTARRAYSFLFNERVDFSRRDSNMHEIDLNLQLLKPFGIEIPPHTLNPILETTNRPWPNRGNLRLPDHFAAIHLGSKGSAANWPLSNYIKLINLLVDIVPVVITGQLQTSGALSPRAINLTNKTDFNDLMHIISKASLFISGGTGPLHLASALGRPLIGFFPNRSHLGPRRWGPRGSNAVSFTPPEQIGHRCRIKEDGSCDCMTGIEINDVIDRARRILV